MYLLPQELEVWYIIPAIRREFARVLTEKHDMTFEEAGKILGITKAAVSQYLNKKRAVKVKLPDEIKKEIEKSSEILSKSPNFAVREISKILRLMKEKKCSCSVCKKFNKTIPEKCNCS